MTAGGRRRERKVVTVLFCDLVGFTSQAESMDPEDVEAILRPYHARVRSELERYGGTVEKFIGDAVMALFGAPVAHEDDPERALRAALAIRDFAVEDGLELRVGITTGEVLVSLDASPAEGEGMASGDVVNTAARLQSAAPVNGILVDEMTYRATRHVVDYGEMLSVEAKGKGRPIAVWEAAQVRARPGVDVAHEARSELVGRKQELGVLRDGLSRVRSSRTSQLLTLVGVPGVGKSRLVHELRRIVDEDPELITWRQGRCLAYGEGVTLWGLGEIVKAQAGIHEQDPPAVAEEKIRGAVEDVLAGSSDVSWVGSNLVSLVGLASESELGGDRRGEAFAAWRLFFEAMAEQRPLVLVLEDLHWADESLLDFVDELVDWVTDVPLLVVGTARPELLEHRPNWGGGKLNATTLAVQPLSDEETARLIGQLLERPLLAAESQEALLERAGGNPLYAEQYAELFRERGSIEELPLPETVQGLIAARLDGLPHEEKELLRDAAVVGKVFWVGALGRDPRTAASTLHSLERKGFVRRQRRSSVEQESELAFAHALVRDVAYGQIARPDRAVKHRRIAEWIEALGRPEDHAEMLAYHWSSALELSRAAAQETGDLAERARLALRAAGDRAAALNAFRAAERYYAQALELWPSGDPERAALVFRHARSLYDVGDDRREHALENARDLLLQAGAREGAGEAESYLAHVAWMRGKRDLVEAHLARAEELVSTAGVSAPKARVLAFSARLRMLAGQHDEAIRTGQQALELTQALTLDELRAQTLSSIGAATFGAGDTSAARELMEEALVIARETNSPIAGSILNNLGIQALAKGDLARGRELTVEALLVSQRFGDQTVARFLRANLLGYDFDLGSWDEAAAAADELIADFERAPHYSESQVRRYRAEARFARGDVDGALADCELGLAHARDVKDRQALLPSLVVSATISAALGRDIEARAHATEALELADRTWQRDLVPLALEAGRLGIRRELAALAPQAIGPWSTAGMAATEGDFGRAASIVEAADWRSLAGRARLENADVLIQSGRRVEGEAELEKALEFYRSVSATFFVERGERLLAKSA
ncbi:MAG: ATP-binding protein [Gaiellaceae bacterium]